MRSVAERLYWLLTAAATRFQLCRSARGRERRRRRVTPFLTQAVHCADIRCVSPRLCHQRDATIRGSCPLHSPRHPACHLRPVQCGWPCSVQSRDPRLDPFNTQTSNNSLRPPTRPGLNPHPHRFAPRDPDPVDPRAVRHNRPITHASDKSAHFCRRGLPHLGGESAQAGPVPGKPSTLQIIDH